MEQPEELREIDCRLDILKRLDEMQAACEISKQSADVLREAIRYLNGNQLFVVYLRWIEGYRTNRAVAARLGISEQAVGKIVNKKLAGLRAKLFFMAELSSGDRQRMGLDNWELVKDDFDPGGGDYWKGTGPEMNTKTDAASSWAQRDIERRREQANGIVWDDEPEDERPTNADHSGHVVKHRIYERNADRMRWEGETNPRSEPSHKHPDDEAAERMRARWAEKRAERLSREKAERLAALEIEARLKAESPGAIERRREAEKIKQELRADQTGCAGCPIINFRLYAERISRNRA